MQDAATGQKSGQNFKLQVAPETEPTKISFFDIRPESQEQRQKSMAHFSLEKPVEATGNHSEGSHFPNAAAVAELLVNAETLLGHGERELARVLIYQALNLDSKNPLILKKAKQFLNPLKDLSQLLTIQKEICKSELSFENQSELGHLYYKLGNDDLALKMYFDCLNLVIVEDASLFEVYKNMGNIMTRGQDFDGAEEYFHKAFTLNPDSDLLAVNLGTLAIQRNNFQAALERFRTAVTKNPKNDKAWVGLALVHQEMGDIQLAFANIETAIDICPQNRTAVQLFANWCVRESRYLNAIEVVEEYLANVDVDAELSLVLIHLFCKTNKFAMAELEAERVLLWVPEHQQMSEILTELKQMGWNQKNVAN